MLKRSHLRWSRRCRLPWRCTARSLLLQDSPWRAKSRGSAVFWMSREWRWSSCCHTPQAGAGQRTRARKTTGYDDWADWEQERTAPCGRRDLGNSGNESREGSKVRPPKLSMDNATTEKLPGLVARGCGRCPEKGSGSEWLVLWQAVTVRMRCAAVLRALAHLLFAGRPGMAQVSCSATTEF